LLKKGTHVITFLWEEIFELILDAFRKRRALNYLHLSLSTKIGKNSTKPWKP
jgi:hypothetical protein